MEDKLTPPFTVMIYCPDCSFGEDPMGCFDGGEETLDENFPTLATAANRGFDVTSDGIYGFYVIDSQGTQLRWDDKRIEAALRDDSSAPAQEADE